MDIKEFKKKFKDKNYDYDISNWKEQLNEILNMRHDYDKNLSDLVSKKDLEISIWVFEEVAECISAFTKFLKGGKRKKDKYNLIEEMADVIITQEYIKKIAGITDKDIEKAIKIKMERGINRARGGSVISEVWFICFI